MNPALLILIGALWFTFFGGILFAYLENKFQAWGKWLIILFVLAVAVSWFGVMSNKTLTMN